jgi:hypothetical protein
MSDNDSVWTEARWSAFGRSMGYTAGELREFRAHPNNEYVAQNAWRLDEWTIVAEVVESHGCASGHKVGDKLYFSPQGVLETRRGPEQICLAGLVGLAAAVAVVQERIIMGLPPDAMLFRRVGCLDVGVRCGGWGHVAFGLRAIPRRAA